MEKLNDRDDVCEKIKRILKKGMKIELSDHAHGIRMQIVKNCRVITFSVSEDLDECIDSCNKYLNSSLVNMVHDEIEQKKLELKEQLARLRNIERQISTSEKELEGLKLRVMESVVNS